MIRTIFVFACMCLSAGSTIPAANPFRQAVMTPELEVHAGAAWRLSRLHYTNSSGEKGVSEFFYDAAGRMTSSTWKLLNGLRSSQNNYVYDAEGRISEKWRIYTEGRCSLEVFTYSAEGHLVRETFKRSDGRQGHTDYTRGADGRILSVDCHGLGGWFRGKITYHYDQQGRLTSGDLTREGKPFGVIRVERDSLGRVQRETWTLGKWTQTFTREYQQPARQTFTWSSPFLPEGSDPILSEEYAWCDKPAGPSSYTYNAAGRLVEKRFVRSDGLSTLTTYTYTPDGLLTRSVRRYSDGRSGTFTYRYQQRRLVERVFQRSDGFQGRETYTWSQAGHLTGGEWQGFDGWLSGRLIVTTAPQGRPATAVFSGSGDSPDATVEYAHDSRGNLVRVHWAFNNGKTQTYRFEYPATGGQ